MDCQQKIVKQKPQDIKEESEKKAATDQWRWFYGFGMSWLAQMFHLTSLFSSYWSPSLSWVPAARFFLFGRLQKNRPDNSSSSSDIFAIVRYRHSKRSNTFFFYYISDISGWSKVTLAAPAPPPPPLVEGGKQGRRLTNVFECSNFESSSTPLIKMNTLLTRWSSTFSFHNTWRWLVYKLTTVRRLSNRNINMFY